MQALCVARHLVHSLNFEKRTFIQAIIMLGRPEETQRQLVLSKQREREAVRDNVNREILLMQPSASLG